MYVQGRRQVFVNIKYGLLRRVRTHRSVIGGERRRWRCWCGGGGGEEEITYLNFRNFHSVSPLYLVG